MGAHPPMFPPSKINKHSRKKRKKNKKRLAFQIFLNTIHLVGSRAPKNTTSYILCRRVPVNSSLPDMKKPFGVSLAPSLGQQAGRKPHPRGPRSSYAQGRSGARVREGRGLPTTASPRRSTEHPPTWASRAGSVTFGVLSSVPSKTSISNRTRDHCQLDMGFEQTWSALPPCLPRL